MADNPKTPKTTLNRIITRGALIALAVIGLTGLIYLSLMVRQTEPDYYQPARTILITVRERLDASFSGEAQLIKQLKNTHKELEAAIAALDQLNIDPEYQHDVDALRIRLRTLEDAKHLSQTSPEQLHLAYREIEDQISALIDKLDRREH